jgi:hypothetical protein
MGALSKAKDEQAKAIADAAVKDAAIATAKDDHATATADTVVKDPATALEYLIDREFKSEDDELTLEFLGIIAMQLSQQPKLSWKQAAEAFKALSYLIIDLHRKRTVEVITDVIAKAVSLATKRVRDELEAATEQLTAAAVTSTNTVEELREECRNVVSELRDAVEEVSTSLENTGAARKQEVSGAGGGEIGVPDTYANSLKKKIPAMHATMVARAELQKRRIRLVKATGMEGDGLGDLTEKQWVGKANMALTLMEEQEELEGKPEVVNFVGVSKEREDRGVMFELNSSEAAGWLRGKQVMSVFLAKMGSTVDFKMQSYEVVMDWVPVSYDADSSAAWKRVEQSNNLRESAILESTWIKPAHLRSEGQRTAIAIFRLATREDANQIIENGLYVEGKKVWGRKQVQEPKRCLKCQCFGEHKAVKCGSIHDVCGRCGKQHRTSLCAENAKEKWECSNCKAMGNESHKGHGAADRRCPVFLARVDRMNKTRQENKYKYFCTTDPATWETYEHNDQDNDEQNKVDSHTQGQKGGSQRWEVAGARKGGGKKGGGGGGGEGSGDTQRQADKGGEVREDTRAGGSGSRDKDNGNAQTEAPRNTSGVRVGSSGKGYEGATSSQEARPRAYRQEAQRVPGPSQTTLKEMWKGKERDFRSWSEDIDARMRELEMDRQLSPYPYV